MPKELEGIPLSRFEEPIRVALHNYNAISEGTIEFEQDKACRLELTPDKPNSARSESVVRYFGLDLGKLYIIAFKPGDGTGSEADYKLDELEIDPSYPKKTLIVPRKKMGTHSEVHLSLVRHKTEDAHAEPQLYKGTMDLLGLDGNKVKKIGQLGHLESSVGHSPVTTYTVGYRKVRGREIRFGDPHAVYNKVPDNIQVCAFLAVNQQLAELGYSTAFKMLHPKLPF